MEAWRRRPPPFKYVKSHLLQEKSLSSVRERKENKERKKETARCLNLIMLALLLCFCFVVVACRSVNAIIPGGPRSLLRSRKEEMLKRPPLPAPTNNRTDPHHSAHTRSQGQRRREGFAGAANHIPQSSHCIFSASSHHHHHHQQQE